MYLDAWGGELTPRPFRHLMRRAAAPLVHRPSSQRPFSPRRSRRTRTILNKTHIQAGQTITFSHAITHVSIATTPFFVYRQLLYKEPTRTHAQGTDPRVALGA